MGSLCVDTKRFMLEVSSSRMAVEMGPSKHSSVWPPASPSEQTVQTGFPLLLPRWTGTAATRLETATSGTPRSGSKGRGQNTDPQSMDYLNGLPKWTTPESHLKGEKRLFEARHIIVLTIPYAFALETFHTCDPLVSLHNPNPNPSNSCFSPFKWLSGVVHLGNPFRQSMDWGSVFCPLPEVSLTLPWVNCVLISKLWVQSTRLALNRLKSLSSLVKPGRTQHGVHKTWFLVKSRMVISWLEENGVGRGEGGGGVGGASHAYCLSWVLALPHVWQNVLLELEGVAERKREMRTHLPPMPIGFKLQRECFCS